jgi:hypothetical protein
MTVSTISSLDDKAGAAHEARDSEQVCAKVLGGDYIALPDNVPLVFQTTVPNVRPKDKVRVEYLRKLSDNRVWVPAEKRPPKHQSLIIFDWDDTLMYSSFISHGCPGGVSAATKQHLLKIESAAYDLLDMALGLGHTFIITNASEGWVQDCVSRYMPSLKVVLERIPVISARSRHESACSNLSQWKQCAFLDLGNKLDKEIITNLVSVGDSNFEMDAAQILGQQFSRSLIKTVKLKESPTAEELMKQLALIVRNFKNIVEKATNMAIRLERS